jgi:hypothetical protein
MGMAGSRESEPWEEDAMKKVGVFHRRIATLVACLILCGVATTLSGCGCTSSYWESFLTLGIGCQYCGKNINGSRCLTREGQKYKSCPCAADSPAGRLKDVFIGEACCCSGE